MARDFLFSSSTSDVALIWLIATAAAAIGFMKGAPGRLLPGWHQLGQDNRGFLENLHRHLEASYPQAGQPFYAVRLWTNLIWQPAYLAVIAVHLHGALPAVTTLSQAQRGLYVDGYRLAPGPQYRDNVPAMITRTGRDLRGFADTVLDEINDLTKLRRRPAHYLLAERMLGLMVRLRHFQPQLGVADQLRFAALWLDAMDLTGHGDLDVVELPDGRQAAIVMRKGCCLDYLITPDRLCASCPKQTKTLLVARQRENALAELEMRAD